MSVHSQGIGVSMGPLSPIGPTQDSPLSKIISPEPMSIEKTFTDNNIGHGLTSATIPNRPTTNNHKPTKWKRIACERRSLDNVSDLGEGKIRSKNGEGKAKDELDSSRKRDGG